MDDWAEWIISGLLARGLAIPEDVGVVGVGDSRLAELRGGVPISSVQLPAAAVGEAAAEFHRLRAANCPHEA